MFRHYGKIDSSKDSRIHIIKTEKMKSLFQHEHLQRLDIFAGASKVMRYRTEEYILPSLEISIPCPISWLGILISDI